MDGKILVKAGCRFLCVNSCEYWSGYNIVYFKDFFSIPLPYCGILATVGDAISLGHRKRWNF